MSKEKEEPAYADEFGKYTIAVALLGILYKNGELPEKAYKRIKVEYEKDVEKYRKLC